MFHLRYNGWKKNIFTGVMGGLKFIPFFFKGLHMFQGDAGVLPSTQDFFWPVFFVCP